MQECQHFRCHHETWRAAGPPRMQASSSSEAWNKRREADWDKAVRKHIYKELWLGCQTGFVSAWAVLKSSSFPESQRPQTIEGQSGDAPCAKQQIGDVGVGISVLLLITIIEPNPCGLSFLGYWGVVMKSPGILWRWSKITSHHCNPSQRWGTSHHHLSLGF